MLTTQILLATQTVSPLHPAIIWVIVGVILGSSELLLPKTVPKAFKFMPLIMGICALIVAFLLWRSNVFYRIPHSLQILYWMSLSGACTLWIRPLFRQKKTSSLFETTEAITLTEIPAGEIGRVRFEGNSWAASCENRRQAIPAHTKVYVLRREGNTLIVVPNPLLDV
ncbi:NfeD family protein [Roseofilum sp. Belize Diploria]|uniref:NfeD family protein n=1 Tax=Roseofilum sp. Belize Diploria TaxID=2821501 RepID=UPI001B1F2443|nr:NfeD family protein [Roseofilum sp. Belize Diploria]MBP0010287.1 NfeD family protein [Roseofilum sp. Belize Diploria]